MKGLARAIKGFAHHLGCIVIECGTLEKRKDISHWASSRSPPRRAGSSGGTAAHMPGGRDCPICASMQRPKERTLRRQWLTKS
jgi:hypothetical protein